MPCWSDTYPVGASSAVVASIDGQHSFLVKVRWLTAVWMAERRTAARWHVCCGGGCAVQLCEQGEDAGGSEPLAHVQPVRGRRGWVNGCDCGCRTSFTMTVHNQADVQITVDPCLQSETTFDAASKDTKLSTSLPPTSRLSVKWTEKQATDVAIAEPAKQPLSILVEHEHLFSVGEGMLLMDSTFHYDIRFGASACLIVCVERPLAQQRDGVEFGRACGQPGASAVGGGGEPEAMGRVAGQRGWQCTQDGMAVTGGSRRVLMIGAEAAAAAADRV